MITKKYRLENLGCAHCAAKIEERVGAMPEVQEAVLTFALHQLRVTAEDPDALLEEIRQIAKVVEPGVEIKAWTRSSRSAAGQKKKEEHHHEHGKSCGCGHDHGHHHEHGESCGCGHDHGHHHEHGKSCGCGHDHGHHHEHGESCGCGHDHGHHHEHGESCDCGHDHGHHHEHGESCGCDHEHENHQDDHQQGHEHNHGEGSLRTIIVGAALFAAGILIQALSGIHAGEAMNVAAVSAAVLFIVAYIILGKDIIWAAVKGIGNGQIFDENFLMSIATIGAIVIGEYAEAVGVMLFFQVGEYFEHRAVEKSRSAIMDAVDMRPEVVTRQIGVRTEIIPAEEAEIGDILIVRPGDRIPLDGRVIEGSTQIDTSPVTGEPVPVLAESGSNVISGCVNVSGLIKIEVEKTLDESMVTRILDSVENAAASKPQMERFITRFSKVYTPIVVGIALLTAIIPSLVTGNWGYWVYTALTFLVISCPCAMVLSVPLAFFAGIGAGSRKGILFKGGTALEALRKVKAIVMDKTGTITKGNFVVQKIITQNDYTRKQVLEAAVSCELNSTHPIAQSILAAAKEELSALPAAPENVIEVAGKGVKARIGEADVLCGNDKLMSEAGVSMEGLEAVYGTRVFVAIDGQLAGEILISDTIKEDAVEAVKQLKAAQVSTTMLTGDSKGSAEAVARMVGVDHVRAELLPQDKLEALQEIRAEQGGVMFVGDGINDAPVLAGADVGAAMGSGADAAIEAADVVFMTSKMEAIPQAMGIARRAMQVAVQNVVFALAVKIIVMILGLIGIANMWLAVFADSGVALLCVLNSVRILRK